MASNLKVTELDFFQIKENFKAYLKAQQDKGKFVDYDFDGSGMQKILRCLKNFQGIQQACQTSFEMLFCKGQMPPHYVYRDPNWAIYHGCF